MILCGPPGHLPVTNQPTPQTAAGPRGRDGGCGFGDQGASRRRQGARSSSGDNAGKRLSGVDKSGVIHSIFRLVTHGTGKSPPFVDDLFYKSPLI